MNLPCNNMAYQHLDIYRLWNDRDTVTGFCRTDQYVE